MLPYRKDNFQVVQHFDLPWEAPLAPAHHVVLTEEDGRDTDNTNTKTFLTCIRYVYHRIAKKVLDPDWSILFQGCALYFPYYTALLNAVECSIHLDGPF